MLIFSFKKLAQLYNFFLQNFGIWKNRFLWKKNRLIVLCGKNRLVKKSINRFTALAGPAFKALGGPKIAPRDQDALNCHSELQVIGICFDGQKDWRHNLPRAAASVQTKSFSIPTIITSSSQIQGKNIWLINQIYWVYCSHFKEIRRINLFAWVTCSYSMHVSGFPEPPTMIYTIIL